MSGYALLFTVLSIGLFSRVNTREINYNVTGLPSTTTSEGHSFWKFERPDGAFDILYDCSLSSIQKGRIEIFEEEHPGKVNSLIIQNCEDITLSQGEYRDNWDTPSFFVREIILKNIKTLMLLNTDCCTHTMSGWRKEVHISDVENLILEENSLAILKNVSLSLHNATILNLKRRDISRGISKLYLQGVNVKELEERAIDLYDTDGVFIMRDTHFDYVGKKAFLVDGSVVEISNSTFKYLDNEAFYINTSEKFIFADNHVENMQSPFNVTSPNVQIVGNTFENIRTPWLNGITVGDGRNQISAISGVFNISRNSMRLYPEGFYKINPRTVVDVGFSDNNFNCDCQYWSLNEVTDPNSVIHILIKNSNNNVCVNLGNCALGKVLRNMNDVCDETFVCSEKKSKISVEARLENILSALENMLGKIGCLTPEDESLKVSSEISPVAESSTGSKSS